MVKKAYLNRAFTLAEVLITLAIIGVVAALTIPVLMKAYQEHEAVAKVKETYSLVAQAVGQWESELNCPGEFTKCVSAMEWNWGEVPTSPEDDKDHMLGWVNYLKVIKKRTTRWEGTVDWMDYDSYQMDGVTPTNTYQGVGKNYETHRTFQYILANGTILAISAFNFGPGGNTEFMWMDINGAKKPNRIGKDQFPIGFSRGWDGKWDITPYHAECNYWGTANGVCSYNCPDPCNPDDGHSPTAYVLKYNKLPDLEKMGYPASP